MKFHIFWFEDYHPQGGLSDHAGFVEAASIDEARAAMFEVFSRNDNDLRRYQIANEALEVLETGQLFHEGWLPSNKKDNPWIKPDEELYGMTWRNRLINS